MEQNYTEKNLIRFIYGECDALEKMEIENALEHDFALYGIYKNIHNSYKQLPKVKFKPKMGVINRILDYSNQSNTISL
jgi:hypothetical protein